MSFVDQKAARATAVSLITGFLGSGKTTLLNYLLAHPDMDQTAVLINEFGEVGLDHLLVKELDEDVVLLKSGCICCTVRGELVDGLKELYMKRLAGTIPAFDRITIETTGLADPLPIISCLMEDPLFKHVYRLDGLITTVDAVHGYDQLDEHEEAVRQAAVADRLIITKSDLTDERATNLLRGRLHNLNPGASIFFAHFGQVEPKHLFDAGLFNPRTKSLNVQRWLNDVAYDSTERHGHDQEQIDVNRHDEHIAAFCITIDEPIAWDVFKRWYEDLTEKKGDYMLRVKGIVNILGEEEPFAIHCVRSTQHAPARLPAWSGDDRRSKIVFITRDLGREEIESSLREYLCDTRLPGTDSAPVTTDSGRGGKRARRERWLNHAELSHLFAVLADEPNVMAADAIRLMLLTGTRSNEVLEAKWEQFDLERAIWTKPALVLGKWGSRKILLNGPAVRLLTAMRARVRIGPYVFPGESPDAPLASIEDVWSQATAAAEIEDADLQGVHPSLARHLLDGLSAPVVERLLGLAGVHAENAAER